MSFSSMSFAGLDTAEAGKLRNYLHFRPAEALEKKTLLEREHLSASLDFLDQLTDDIPHGECVFVLVEVFAVSSVFPMGRAAVFL